MTKIIVGGVIKSNDKYILVQEAKESCKGKWNIPAGHLETNESIIEGACREISEETGYKVELTGIAELSNKVLEDNIVVFIIFCGNIVGKNIKYNTKEILDVKAFSYSELQNMKDELRDYEMIMNAINQVENNKVGELSIVKVL